MREKRSAAFCFQEHAAIEAIHGRWSGRERQTALAVYQAMTYAASIRFRDGGREGFETTPAEIAVYAGAKATTVRQYAAAFEELGLIVQQRQVNERGGDMPSVWSLTSPTATGGALEDAPPGEGGAPEDHPSSPRASAGDHPTRARQDGSEEGRRRIEASASIRTISSQPEEKELAAEFEDWLADHKAVTGREPPRPGSKIRRSIFAMYRARRRDDKLTAAELKLATVGAYNDEFRRANGHYGHESVLRPKKCLELVDKGRAHQAAPPPKDMSAYRVGRGKRRSAS